MGSDKAETKACPYCGEEVKAVAIVCKHCGKNIGSKSVQPYGHFLKTPLGRGLLIGIIVIAAVGAIWGVFNIVQDRRDSQKEVDDYEACIRSLTDEQLDDEIQSLEAGGTAPYCGGEP